MRPAPLPSEEQERLDTIQALKILDTSPEERFDRITRVAQRLFDVSAAALTIVDKDRQWFKSSQGLNIKETSRDGAFCAHTILETNTLVVSDTLLDERFSDNPMVTGDPNIRFYAGHPIQAPNRHKIGALCIIDRKPRTMSQTELKLLEGLAKLAQFEISKGDTSSNEKLTRESEKKFFQSLLKYFIDFSKSMKTPMGVMVVRVPALFDGKRIAKPIHHDRMLIEVAKILNSSVRVSDIVGALDTDGFYVLFPKCNETGLKIVLDRIDENSKVLQTKLHCAPTYKLQIREVMWTPQNRETVEQLVQKGNELLHQCQ